MMTDDFCIDVVGSDCVDPPEPCVPNFEHIPANQLPVRDIATYIPQIYTDPVFLVFHTHGIPTTLPKTVML